MAERKHLLARFTNDGARIVSALSLVLGATGCSALTGEAGEADATNSSSGTAGGVDENDLSRTVYAMAVAELNRNGEVDRVDPTLEGIVFEPNGNVTRGGLATIRLEENQDSSDVLVASPYRVVFLPDGTMLVNGNCSLIQSGERMFIACLFKSYGQIGVLSEDPLS